MTEPASADRSAAESAKRGPRGRRAGERMFASAREGDAEAREAVVRVASTPGHRLRDAARLELADWWGRDREDRFRPAVVATGAVAREGPARLRTLALLGRLAGNWDEEDARSAWRLVTDEDTDVRLTTAAACRAATGTMLAALWDGAGGGRGPLRDVLMVNPEPPPAPRLAALWDEWFADPGDPLGEALFRWGLPVRDPGRVASTIAGLEPGVAREPRERAALVYALLLGDARLRGAAAERLVPPLDPELVEELCGRVLQRPEAAGVCVERGIVPRDPVRRALFYVVTRQAEQHRALDPDGSLLSLAYASAPEPERARAREAMLANGELDLVRVIVGDDRRAGLAGMPRAEARYLAERLADRRAWDELWALVRDLPVADAAELVRLLGPWAPREEDGFRYHRALRDTDPAVVGEGVARLGERPLEPHASLRLHDHVPLDLSFSPQWSPGAPEGPFLAVASVSRVVSVVDLRTARLVRRFAEPLRGVDRVLHVGSGAVIAHALSSGGESLLLRCADGGTRPLRAAARPVTSLALLGDDGGFAAGTANGELLLGDPDGDVRTLSAADLGLGGHRLPERIAVHRGSGRIAAHGGSPGVHLIDPAARSATTLRTADPVDNAVFLDADTLLCRLEGGPVRRLSLRDRRPGPPSETKQFGPGRLRALPRTGEAVFTCAYGDLHVYGGDPPERVHVRPSPDRRPCCPAVSPDGSLLAVGRRDGRIEVFDLRPRELAAVARRPAASLVPRDLRLVTDVLGAGTLARETRTALELLRASLEHRFRSEVEVGEAARLPAGDHDIGL